MSPLKGGHQQLHRSCSEKSEECDKMGISDAAKTRILVAFACVQVVFTAAILFGWPALLVVLKDEGQYDELCEDVSSSSVDNTSTSSLSSSVPTQRGLAKCNAQEVRLNLIFTVSFIFNAISCLSGPVFDVIGPRLSNLAGGIVSDGSSMCLSRSCLSFS